MSQTRADQSRWEEFARRDAAYYIDPTLGPGRSDEEFVAGGRGIVDWALGWASEVDRSGRALEIGCGIGRNTVHLAERFARVDAVDISPTMIERARGLGLPDNVTLTALSGRGELEPFAPASFGYVFSHLVFQHISDPAVIATYVHEVGRVLKPGGIAQLQFDTRPARALLSLAQRLPDPLLPRLQRRGIRRVARDSAWLAGLGRRAGLELVTERDPGSSQHWYLWRRGRG